MSKLSINLLQPDLLPKKPLWTLSRVLYVWLITLIVMISLVFLTQFNLASLGKQFDATNMVNNNQKERLATLEVAVTKNREDAKLLEQLKTLKLVIANKKQLHSQLTDPRKTYSAGFSTVMGELAELHHKNISLQHVNIDSNHITFSGLARSPEAVPNWLSGFESSTFLSGKKFINFTLSENEQQITEFVVSSASSSTLDTVLNGEK